MAKESISYIEKRKKVNKDRGIALKWGGRIVALWRHYYTRTLTAPHTKYYDSIEEITQRHLRVSGTTSEQLGRKIFGLFKAHKISKFRRMKEIVIIKMHSKYFNF